MLFALALIPVAVLLVIIYFCDRKEKEPLGLLTGLFFAGAGMIIPIIIVELIGQLILNAIIPRSSVLNSIILATLIIAPAEELGKFLVLRLITWKNKHFNYSFDAIVYAVFVSLGFAALENIEYVFASGLRTAVLRMFTAVPGHACYAVAMGFFYSRAKRAQLTNDKSGYKRNMALSILVPIAGHGVYDAIIMAARNFDNLTAMFGLLLWIVYVIALFVISIIAIVYSSKHDYCIVTLPSAVQTIYRPAVMGTWRCKCGTENRFNFCSQCGSPRPVVETWMCPRCRSVSSFKFCGNCGCPRPIVQGMPGAPVAPGAQGVPANPYANPYSNPPAQ